MTNSAGSAPLSEAPAGMSPAQLSQLLRQVRTALGEPARPYPELTDEVLHTQLGLAIEDYSSMIFDWLISQQWGQLHGNDVNTTNFVLAFTNKGLDYTEQFTAAYGKQTGVTSNSPWELKKDYIEVVAGQQVYEIAAGREINEVLWKVPPVLGGGGVGSPGSLSWLAQTNGWMAGGQAASAILPTYSTLLYAQDRLQRNRVNLSEHTYKVTGGPNGTKHLHLYPVPGSTSEIPDRNGRHETGDRVFYWYYDTDDSNRDKCQEANEDIIHLPDEVPLQLLTWGKMNLLARVRIRKLLVRNAAEYVGTVRGMFKGDMPSPSKDRPTITVDYQMMLTRAKETGDAVVKEIMDSLEKISSLSMLERQAKEAQALNQILRYKPARNPFIMK